MNGINISSPLPLWDDRQGWRECGSRYGTCAARARVRGAAYGNRAIAIAW